MGYMPDEIEHLRLAKEYSVGQYVNDQTEIVELGIEDRPKTDMKGNPKPYTFFSNKTTLWLLLLKF